MTTKRKWLEIWLKERNEALRSQDVEQFKAFYERWKARGFYALNLPPDNVIEVSLRKMLYNLKNATEEEKTEAEKWLTERGFTTDLG